MKFSDILKNAPEQAPPAAPKRPPPLGPYDESPRGTGMSFADTAPPAPASTGASGAFGRPAAEPPQPAAPAAPPPLSDVEIEELYRDLGPFFESAAAGALSPGKEDAGRLLKVRALVERPDHRLLALAVQDRSCVSTGARGLHVFLTASFLARGLGLDDEERLAYLIASLSGAPPAPRPGFDPEAERQKAEAFMLASAFHGLIHPETLPPLRPEQAAASLVEHKAKDYSPAAVRRFINEFSLFPPGSVVRLSSGRLAVVREPHPGYPTRPSVRLLDAPEGVSEFLDLRQHPLIRIEALKDPNKELEPLRRRRRRSHMGWNILGF